MKKRLLAAFLALVMTTACMSGCGKKTSTGKSESANIDWNKTGYPIVNEPVTFTVGVPVGSVSQANWEDLDWVKELKKESGINLEFNVYQNNEAINLMFTSMDYPDISIGLGTDKQINDAAMGGNIYELDDLIKDYAPNWNDYFTKNKDTKKSISFEDGHIYSLPMIREESYNYSLRDQWLIEKSWLDELNLKMPTTMDEFYNVLKAFKANAGKGSIPKDVVPYYLYGIVNDVGGALDFINSFGVKVVNEKYFVTLDDKGKVEFNYTDESIKEPIKFLNKMVKEGLIPKESFTDSWDTYLTKIKSTTTTIGCYHAYSNRDITDTKTVDLAPLASGNGKKPIIRSQQNIISKNFFTIYSKCKYPEIAMRLANMIAEQDWSVEASYGMIGGDDTTVSKSDDGKYLINSGNGDYEGLHVPGERVPYLITKDISKLIEMDKTAKNYSRAKAVEEIYAPYALDNKYLYPTFVMSETNIDRITEMNLDISTYLRKTFAEWVMYGGVDEGWDKYIKQMKAYGLDEYLSLLQEELDGFNKR